MNKLMGFYELKESGLPTIPWQQFDANTTFNDRFLWTIRSAVYIGKDLNLPRAVGVDAKEAKDAANKILNKIGDNGIVIYYPYFIAEKSGTLNIFNDKIVIEAVKDDLWNMVTHSDREVTIIINNHKVIHGNENFLNDCELNQITKYVNEIKRMFRGYLLEGKNILLEWSMAFNTDINKKPIGEKYLVFYEIRTT